MRGATGPLVVVGDTVLDVDVEGESERLCPDAPAPVVDVGAEHPRPGGAGLAALLAARSGAEVVLVTALADDPSGRMLAGLLTPHLSVVRLPLRGTTVRKSRIRVRGRTLLRLDTGDGVAPAGGGEAAARALRGAGAVLVSDYGRGAADAVRDLLGGLGVPVVWDPHPRGSPPPPGCALVTPSEAEAAVLCGRTPAGARTAGASYGRAPADPGQAARHLVAALRAGAVAVTLGARGAVLACEDGHRSHLPVPPSSAVSSMAAASAVSLPTAPAAPFEGRDTCGAGDRLAGAAALALRDGAPVRDAVAAGVREAARFVNEGGAASVRPVPSRAEAVPDGDDRGASRIRSLNGDGSGTASLRPAVQGTGDGPRDALRTAEAVRAGGGRLIATGGCFDLLHAGHVSLLRRARALGDALVVCVNSDASVRRLKGPGRPVVGQHDRVEVLRALGCVDAVLVFDEDTPCAAIELLRPEVWVKGGDYDGRVLPETAVLDRLGAESVVLSHVPGRSTTGLIAAAQAAS
ncbi:adenylyltransferase/cytidyltransferase family protein [Streptosporangium longisporum]|uniref:PfkB family carbohydrate kinase n=1 Tax=Streptosporangium longisporum TaxID=46187 RepID=A0ABP6L919_9ACTN